MASTTLPRNPAPAARPAPSLVPGGQRRRRWSLALVAALVTLSSALAFVVLWMNAGGREPALALRDDVAAGQVIEDDDLAVVRVAADGVTFVASSARDQVVGQPAATDLLAGMLLTPDAVGSDEGLEAGTAVIAIPVPPSEIPTADLETGDRVLLYRTTPGGAAGAAAPATTSGEGGEGAPAGDPGTGLIGEGRVFSAQADEGGTGGDIRVSVTVPQSLAPAIAVAIQEDVIYLALAADHG